MSLSKLSSLANDTIELKTTNTNTTLKKVSEKKKKHMNASERFPLDEVNILLWSADVPVYFFVICV